MGWSVPGPRVRSPGPLPAGGTHLLGDRGQLRGRCWIFLALWLPAARLPAVASAAAPGFRITVQQEASAAGRATQLRLRSGNGPWRLQALGRRHPGGAEWVRWTAEGASGRWIVGTVRGWGGRKGPGWADPLSRRGVRQRPRSTLAAGPTGLTWVQERGSSWSACGAGRGPHGRPAGVVAVGAPRATLGAEVVDGRVRAACTWAGTGPVAPAGEVVVAGAHGEGRLGIGGGRSPAGLTVEALAARGHRTGWIVRSGMRTGAGGLRLRADLRRTRGVVRSGWRVDCERRRAGGTVRAWIRARASGVRVGLSHAAGDGSSVALESGGMRRRASCAVTGRVAGARIGLRVDLSVARRGGASFALGPGVPAWRGNLEWRRGRAPTVRVAWTGAVGSR